MNGVEGFYNSNVQQEWDRLDRHRIEFAVTLRAFADYLPPPPAAVADIGGGPGRYTIALGRQGYRVTLIDLSQAELDFARARAAEASVELAGCLRADARDLAAVPTAAFDAVLLMGPMYHLIALADREQALREAARVLRPGGLLCATFITRYAPVRWAAYHDPLWPVAAHEQFDRLLRTGVLLSGKNFTDAYYAHPTEVVPLMEAAGFATLALIGVEGVVSHIEERINSLQGEAWQAWVELSYRIGNDPAAHACADHLLYIGERRVSGP